MFDADAAVGTLLQTAADLADEVRRLRRENAALRDPSRNRKKLTSSDVRRIRQWHANGTTQRELADMFAVSSPTISRIVRGLYHAEA